MSNNETTNPNFEKKIIDIIGLNRFLEKIKEYSEGYTQNYVAGYAPKKDGTNATGTWPISVNYAANAGKLGDNAPSYYAAASALNSYALKTELDKYALKTEIPSVPSLSGYATQSWVLDKGYITGITGTMVTNALGYTPYNSANFTKNNIASTLGISGWALASSKPTYTASEVGALPIDGGTITGTLQIKRNAPAIQYLNTDGTVWGWLGFSAESLPSIWESNGTKNYTIIHSGNYTSYSPKLDGTGATGTWPINISGNATTATTLTNAPVLAVSGSSQITVTAGEKTSEAFTVPYATAAGSATSLTSAPKLAVSGTTQITVTAGKKTSGAFTVPYATAAETATSATTAETATSATTATNLTNAPVLAVSGSSQITVTAGEKTSDAFTVPYATAAGSATSATTATTATNLTNKPVLAASGTTQITVKAGEKTSDAFTVPYATAAGSAGSATTATNLTNKPVLAASGSTQITVKAGEKTSDAFTVPYATAAGSAGSATSATTATTATNLANKPVLAASGTTQITVKAGEKTSDAFTVPYATAAGKVANALTLKLPTTTVTFDGSGVKTFDVTAAALGLTNAIIYIGKTSTALSDGATTNPITINSSSVTAVTGNVVIDSNDKKEYIWNGTKWEEFGNEGNWKPVQSPVSDPGVNGSSTSFISSISQDANGVITAYKKSVNFAGYKTTQTAVSSPTASGSEISFIDTISQNANGVITPTRKTVRSASASQSGVVTTDAQTFAGAKTFNGGIIGNLTGNVTGNVSGSSGSCTGNAATASVANKAVQDSDGNAINTTYLKKSGGTVTGPIEIMSSLSGSYNEGLRITAASNDWAGITFGSTGLSGAPTDGWFAALTPEDQFIISPNDSTRNTGLNLTAGGDAKWRDNIIVHAGNYTSYQVDTKNTAGSTNTSSKIYLIGATSQAANPQTYSHDTAYVGTDGCIYSTNFITTSDRRMKENIEELQDCSKSLELGFYEFDYKTGGHSAGHVAQDVREVYPAFVHGEETETNNLSVDYNALHTMQIKALKDKVVTLENENNDLKNRVEKLEALIEQMLQQSQK